jgi:hypothetical protein
MSSLPFISHHLFVSAAVPNRAVPRELPQDVLPVIGYRSESEPVEVPNGVELSSLMRDSLQASVLGGDTT